jgi:hypothetical protein
VVTDNGNGNYESHFIDKRDFMLDKHTLKDIAYKDKIPLLIIGNTVNTILERTTTPKQTHLF